MARIQKCPQCGHHLPDTIEESARTDRAQSLVSGTRIWWGALIQFAICTAFMLIFKFPPTMIALFGGFIFVGAFISSLVKYRALVAKHQPQAPVARPRLHRILTVAIAICSFVFLGILLFGTVIFLNAWSRWHLYEGQPFHRSEFIVTRVYYQRLSHGSVDTYASGTVEGNQEWMDLRPYLQIRPDNQAELESLVPPGTPIPIYLYSDLRGRSRVQIFGDQPPAENYRRTVVNALNYGLSCLAALAGIIFVLTRLRRGCFVEESSSYPEAELLKISNG
jgi:hypothetical protein